MVIDDKFYEIYSGIEDELKENSQKRAKSLGVPDIKASIDMITGKSYEILKKELGELPDNLSIEDYNEWIREGEKTQEFEVLRFMLLASITLYFGDSNSNSYLKSDNIFGYTGCFKNLEIFFSLTDKAKGELSKNILKTLQASNREIDIVSYFNNKVYIEDVELIASYLSSSDEQEEEESSSDLIELIIGAFGEDIEDKAKTITEVYRKMLAANFGLKTYKAVMTLSAEKDKALIGLKTDGGVRAEKTEFSEAAKIGLQYVPILRNMLSHLKVSNERQFKPDIIIKQFNTDQNKILYFPRKILEFTSLSKITEAKATNSNYAYCSSIKEGSPLAKFRDASKNLESYCKFIYYKMEREIVNFTVALCTDSYNKLDKKARDKHTLEEILTNPLCELNDEFTAKIHSGLIYYMKCVTTAVILVSCNTEKKKLAGRTISNIIDFRIKVACNMAINNRVLNLMSNREFCGILSSQMYKNKDTLATKNPIEESLELSDHYGNRMIDYCYIFNTDLAFGRPIFAYKALEAVQAQGKQLSWQELLLGENPDGSLCISGQGQKVNLQGGTLHYLIAGSRSGKGVAGYGLFAPAIASGIPVFYCDRKPDTAVVLKKLAPNMFAVNGGQHGTEDYAHLFEPSSILRRIKLPKYLEGTFGALDANNVVVHDYIYFRALLLIFNLVLYIEKGMTYDGPGQQETYNAIKSKLSNGMLVVIDEFTNFMDNFLGEKPTTTGWFKECISNAKIKQFRKELINIKTAMDKDSKKGEDCHDALETALDVAKASISLESLYFTSLAEKYQALVKDYGGRFNAGASNFIKSQVQIFIIGQSFPVKYMGGQLEFKRSNGQTSASRFNATTHTTKVGTGPDVLLLEMLNQKLNPDYILGYQPDDKGGIPAYLAQRVKGFPPASYLTLSRRCFCYHKPAVNYTADTIEKLTNTAKHFGSNTQEMKRFLENEFTYYKPYLVLNNGIVPPAELLYDNHTDPKIHDKRQGKGFPEYSESQFVGQVISNCERVGLNWDDLLNDNKAPDGSGGLHPCVGFENYIQQMCGEFPTEALNSSGDVMNMFIQQVYGYDGDWLDFLCDFRPEALFGPGDFFKSVPERLTESFFHETLLVEKNGHSFSSIQGEALESLLSYYSGATVSDEADDIGELGEDTNEDESMLTAEELEDDEAVIEDVEDTNEDNPYTPEPDSVQTPYVIPYRTMEEFTNAKMHTSDYTHKQFLDRFIDFYIQEADGEAKADLYPYWSNYMGVISDFYAFVTSKEPRPGLISGYLPSLINLGEGHYINEINRFKDKMVREMKDTEELLSSPVFNSNSMKNKVTQGINKILTDRLSNMLGPFLKIMFKLRGMEESRGQEALIAYLSSYHLSE